LQQAHATAEHITVPPADQRFGVGVQAVVEAVLSGEELRGQGGHDAGLLTASQGKAANFATGAKGFGPIAA
jgi:hypothetical protein